MVEAGHARYVAGSTPPRLPSARTRVVPSSPSTTTAAGGPPDASTASTAACSGPPSGGRDGAAWLETVGSGTDGAVAGAGLGATPGLGTVPHPVLSPPQQKTANPMI